MEATKSTQNTHYRNKRYILYAITTFFIMTLPFVKINGNQVFLLSFDKLQVHILGVVFDMQELYVMPFLVIMLFVGIFLLTTLAGRFWCGWACPHTIFRVIYRDLIETKILGLRKKISNKQKNPDLSIAGAKFKKFLAIFIWFILSLIAASNFMFYFVPPTDFFSYLANYHEHMVLIGFVAAITMFLTLEIVFVGETFCIYVCPYCRVQSVLYDNHTKTVIYDVNRGSKIYDENGNKLDKSAITGECVNCNHCVQVCPTHIDIRKGLQLECINCLECADACSLVMGKMGKTSLVRWSSAEGMKNNKGVKYFRAKTIGYIIVLLIALSVAIALSSGKSTMLLNINRTTELYKILDNGEVENHYTFLFQNTDNVEHTYYFEIVGRSDITIKKPLEPFVIKAGEKLRKRVFLTTSQNLSADSKNDTIIPIIIRSFALDDENVSIEKESIFVYPK